MTLLSNLLIAFAFSVCTFNGSFDDETPVVQASIIQRAEPGIIAVCDQAKTTIKE